MLAVQGDFEKHLMALQYLGLPAIEVRTTDELEQVDRLIIPGGESTTVGLLLERFGLGAAIQQRVADSMPIWGTCMGMIMLAKEVEGRNQYSLGALDITVQRNAFGRQVHSFETELDFAPIEGKVLGVFIRAPIVTRIGEGVKVLSTLDGKVVAVQSGSILATSFHPELTPDTRIHEWFATQNP